MGWAADDAEVGPDKSDDTTRVEMLTDGVFSISLTLLVLDLVVPAGLASPDDVNRSLGELTPNFFALALSFVVIGRFWIAHHQTFRLIDGADVMLLWLNLLFLATIALLPFTTRLVAEYGEFPVPTAAYAASIVAASAASAAIHWWAIVRLDQRSVASCASRGGCPGGR